MGSEKSCDGKNNDCDISMDEDFLVILFDGTLVSGVGMVCGVGECVGGKIICNVVGMGILCFIEVVIV